MNFMQDRMLEGLKWDTVGKKTLLTILEIYKVETKLKQKNRISSLMTWGRLIPPAD